MKAKRTAKSIEKSGKLFFWTMMALPYLQFVIFYLVVNFNNVALAFESYDKNTGLTSFAGFANFSEIFKNFSELWGYLKNSIYYFLVNLLIASPLSLLFAYYIFRKFRFGGFFKIILFLPSVICCMVLLVFYKNFCNKAIIELLKKLDVKKAPFLTDQVTRSGVPALWRALTFFSVIMGISGSILLNLNAMVQIPASLLEASKIDGASEFRSFFSIIIPGIWGTMVSLLCVSMASMVSNQAYLFNLFGGTTPYEIRTMGYQMYMLIGPDIPDYTQYPYVSAIGVLLTLIVAPITMGTRKLLTEVGPKDY